MIALSQLPATSILQCSLNRTHAMYEVGATNEAGTTATRRDTGKEAFAFAAACIAAGYPSVTVTDFASGRVFQRDEIATILGIIHRSTDRD